MGTYAGTCPYLVPRLVPKLGTHVPWVRERVRGRPVICIQQVAPAGRRAWPDAPDASRDTCLIRPHA
eukprot:5290369-Prymnesium_polylepis.1